MKRKTRKRVAKLTKGERFLYTLGIMAFFSSLIIKVFCGASISNLKINIEKMDYKIKNQEKKNQSLTMQVNELTSYENINSILKDMGLSYNNENIVVIDKK